MQRHHRRPVPRDLHGIVAIWVLTADYHEGKRNHGGKMTKPSTSISAIPVCLLLRDFRRVRVSSVGDALDDAALALKSRVQWRLGQPGATVKSGHWQPPLLDHARPDHGRHAGFSSAVAPVPASRLSGSSPDQ